MKKAMEIELEYAKNNQGRTLLIWFQIKRTNEFLALNKEVDVARFASIHLILAIVAHIDPELHQMNVRQL